MNLLVNKTAHHHYEVHDTYEAGIKLTGSEVKSLRSKNGSLKEAYVKFLNNEVFLANAYIPPFQGKHARYENYDPSQMRKLLLSKKEIQTIKASLKQKGLTVIPLRIFARKRFIKIEIAVAKGKKEYNKREDLKKKAVKRDIEQKLKALS
jgi:SsrA-binding protein